MAIESFKKGKLVVTNAGTRPIPLVIEAMYKDSTLYQVDFSAEIWKASATFETEIPNFKKVISLSVNAAIADNKILDNYFPSLKERYDGVVINEAYLGKYPINEYRITAELKFEDDILMLDLSGTGISTYLLPAGDGKFVSIDDNVRLDLRQKEEGIDMTLELRNFGVTVTGSKK